MTLRHPVERGGTQRRRFAQLAAKSSHFTSSPAFFVVCLALIAFFLTTHFAHLPLAWQLMAGDLMAAVTLLLLALLKNSAAPRGTCDPAETRRLGSRPAGVP
ncbi:hypothetical protein [Streptomyces sp. NEAU-S7GS2]|uniref:hypothetical protein n=1 Tax=Streptomyces sp. NEAU-S7GS2 TaxID=2202000 RepID=UPI001EF6C4C0|nr:hypothetical protein [Streptomyces sp. NEAU-S7GS2]